MKKLFLLVLCFVLLSGYAQAGAGSKSADVAGTKFANAVGDYLPPLQAFPSWVSEIKKLVKPPIYFYDVKKNETHGPGLLMVDFAKHTFIFWGTGFKLHKRFCYDHVQVKMCLRLRYDDSEGKFTHRRSMEVTQSSDGYCPCTGCSV